MRKSHSRFEESVPNGWDVVWGFVRHCHSHAVRDIDVALFQLHARVGLVEDQWLNGPSGFEMLDNLVVGRSQKLALRNLIDGFPARVMAMRIRRKIGLRRRQSVKTGHGHMLEPARSAAPCEDHRSGRAARR